MNNNQNKRKATDDISVEYFTQYKKQKLESDNSCKMNKIIDITNKKEKVD